ncbi:MAG TPA: pyridoxal-phosphate dependent enzyme [Ohtaekwangia sp.]|uniref:1-aminocyclopropane-1-carboxylate deaminase/D-cysteine desulfhydrase n=1 Tax=Ohtaekwangia sp. TaxID=2066019 RepID=UPI002F91F3FB
MDYFRSQFSDLLSYQFTPVQEFHHPVLHEAGVRLIIKREDLNHPFISGNKWWKLKYNLEEAHRQKQKTLLTFGGAFSNHVYATAAAAREAGFGSIGIIRGEEVLPLNATLRFAQSCGMKLYFISREAYRKKSEADFIADLGERFGNFYLIPEGGSNALAVKGSAGFTLTLSSLSYDYLYLAAGTGGTIAGIIAGTDAAKQIVGVSALKGNFLQQEVEGLLHVYEKAEGISVNNKNWNILNNYHHGGYAKVTPALLAFIKETKESYNLPLDPIYTGKVLWAILEEAKAGLFRKGSTILMIHTGGLQGTAAYKELLV